MARTHAFCVPNRWTRHSSCLLQLRLLVATKEWWLMTHDLYGTVVALDVHIELPKSPWHDTPKVQCVKMTGFEPATFRFGIWRAAVAPHLLSTVSQCYVILLCINNFKNKSLLAFDRALRGSGATKSRVGARAPRSTRPGSLMGCLLERRCDSMTSGIGHQTSYTSRRRIEQHRDQLGTRHLDPHRARRRARRANVELIRQTW